MSATVGAGSGAPGSGGPPGMPPAAGVRALLLSVLLPVFLAACGPGGEPGPEPPPPAPPPPPMEEPLPVPAGRWPGPGPYAPDVDVLDYRVELDLWEDSTEIRGTTRIQLVRRNRGAERFSLDLVGLAVDSVFVGPRAFRDLEQVPPATYRDSLSAGSLPVPFPSESGTGDTLVVVVHYRGEPDDGLILGSTPHGTPSAFADNWPNRARFWFPSVDHPSDKATVTFVVRAPGPWQVVANGAPLSPPTPVAATAGSAVGNRTPPRRTWRWQSDAPIPTYTMVVGATEFSTREVGLAACGRAPRSPRRDGCVEVTTWVFPPDTARAAPSFRRAVEMVDFYTGLIGPFPYAKLAHVQSSTRFGGMENAGAIFYSGEALAEGRNLEDVVAHETAHQWFGDSVTESDWHHLWLSEGFAEYFEALFFEETEGLESFRGQMEEKRRVYLASGVASRPVIDEEEGNLFQLLTPNNYQKGAWVLHMLRGVLRDDVFFRGIREYYRRHAGGTVLTRDFREAMEEVSGRPLGWFFDQWLREPGYPVIRAGIVGEGGDARVALHQEQPDDWPVFRLPAAIEVELEGGDVVRREVELTEESQELELDLPEPPVAVRFDPEGWILTGEPPGAR